MDQEQNPEVIKLLEYAKNKEFVTWDEIAEILGQDFVNSPNMETVLQLLTKNNIRVQEEIEPEMEDDEDDEALEESDEEAEILDEEKEDDSD